MSCAVTASGMIADALRFAEGTGPLVMASRLATDAMPLAVKMTRGPVGPPTDAVAACVPMKLPSVHVACASPLASVRTVAGDTVPPPVPPTNDTLVPTSGSPVLPSTRTTSGCGSTVGFGLPTMAVCPDPEMSERLVGCPVTVSTTVSAGDGLPVMRLATMRAVPLALVTPLPASVDGILAVAGSSDVQITGVFATTLPAWSSAVALYENEEPAVTDCVRGAILICVALNPGPL